MYHYHKLHTAVATLSVSKRDTSRYLLFNKRNELIGWVNEKENDVKFLGPCKWPDQKLAFSGVHIINKKIKFMIINIYYIVLYGHWSNPSFFIFYTPTLPIYFITTYRASQSYW